MSSTNAISPSLNTTHERATSTTPSATLAAAPQQMTPSLLIIPPELRNQIYSYTLLQEQTIELSTVRSINTSALLRTCRQIRQEASRMYYTANEFMFKIHGYRGLKAAPAFRVHLQYSHAGRKNFQLQICRKCRGSIKLDDFAEWLRAYHRDTDTVPRLEPRLCINATLWQTAVRSIFSTIVDGGLPCKDVSTAITLTLVVIKLFPTALPFHGCSLLKAIEDNGGEKRDGFQVRRKKWVSPVRF